jgi:signal peptide peptidase SppA
MNTLPRLATEIFNRPLMIHPRKAEIIVTALAGRLGVSTLGARAPMAFSDLEMAMFAGQPQGTDADDRGYTLVNGIGVVPIMGTLCHRFGYLRPYSGMTGYDGIRQSFLTAMSDPAVKAVVLDINSPGGQVDGAFDLADEIFAMRGVKPIWAILDEVAFSAAYALASAADVITVPRTGGTGSIGVVTMHVDLSQAIANDGVAVTFIQFGDHKTDGNQFQPLPSDVLKTIQTEINEIGGLFVDTVARNRGLSASRVKSTQAACFLGADGVRAGLADKVMAPDAAFRELFKQL